jgi:hypothetical protein
MATHADPLLDTVDRLCTTLERIGDALVSVDADALLETEETLARLLTTFDAASAECPADADALKARIERARSALVRCRRLGACFTSIAGARLRLRSGVALYGSGGAFVEHPVSGATVKVST